MFHEAMTKLDFAMWELECKDIPEPPLAPCYWCGCGLWQSIPEGESEDCAVCECHGWREVGR